MVSRPVNSSGDQLKSTYCLSRLRVTFIWNWNIQSCCLFFALLYKFIEYRSIIFRENLVANMSILKPGT